MASGDHSERLGKRSHDARRHRTQKELLERALKIKEVHFGEEHYEVARTLVNLKDYKKAKKRPRADLED